jgi:hypothetical protein
MFYQRRLMATMYDLSILFALWVGLNHLTHHHFHVDPDIPICFQCVQPEFVFRTIENQLNPISIEQQHKAYMFAQPVRLVQTLDIRNLFEMPTKATRLYSIVCPINVKIL